MSDSLTIDHRLPEATCPVCAKPLDAAGGPPEPPLPGDFTICFGCRNILVFDGCLLPRRPTKDEMKEAAGVPELVQIMNALAALGETDE